MPITYEQRHINKFKLKTPVLLHLTSSQHKSFSIHAPKIWNDLPHHIRSIDSTVTFKSKLKHTFLSNNIESTSENFNKGVDGSS